MSLTAGMYPNRQQEELEKNAEAELFVKIAAQQGIDLNKMNDEEVAALYAYTFDKQAEFPPPEDKKDEDKGEKKDEDEDDEKKKESAAREHATKLAFAREMEQADQLGRHMAHCYIDELNKVGSALMAQQGGAQTETPAADPKEASAREFIGKARDAAKKGADHVIGALSKDRGKFPKALGQHGPDISHVRRMGRAAEAFGKEHGKATAIGAGAAAASGAAGFAAGRHGKKKEGSALDELALEAAVKIASDGGFDPEEAATKVVGIHMQGLEESTKVAATLEQQIEVRALEYLEAAGYPVQWAT